MLMRPNYRIKAYGLGLIWTHRRDGSGMLETTDFERLRAALGDQVLSGFLRLFVWVDRLESLTMLGYWNIQNLPQQSVAFGRNLQTMVWFVGGALYEAARAVIQLKRAGLEARLVDLTSWHELLGFAKRWANKRELIAVRNTIAFHVDEDVIADGIAKTSAGGERLPVVVGDSEKAVAASYRLGLEVLLSGTGLTLQHYETVIQTLAEDHSRFADLVAIVFYQTLNAAGAGLPPRT